MSHRSRFADNRLNTQGYEVNMQIDGKRGNERTPKTVKQAGNSKESQFM